MSKHRADPMNGTLVWWEGFVFWMKYLFMVASIMTLLLAPFWLAKENTWLLITAPVFWSGLVVFILLVPRYVFNNKKNKG